MDRTDDARLLNRFVSSGEEGAFRELVGRHFGLVYSVALRQLNGDTHLAQDVAQSVFTDLARKARFLSSNVVLSGWLYEAARFAANNLIRNEQRRRVREQEASSMHELSSQSDPDWEQLRPVLDTAMGQLSAKDRNAVLLRFFQGKNFRTVGAALGISEDAAQKRVTRALEALRAVLVRRGVTLPLSALAVLLTTSTAHSAPPAVISSIASASLAGAATKTGTAAWLLHAVLRTKTALVASSLAVLIGGISVTAVAFLRPSQTGQFVTADLSAQYNGSLDAVWVPGFDRGNHLASVPHGRHVFAGVPFDVRGVVQLQGRIWKSKGYVFPERVEGIAGGGLCRRIQILHANSSFADTPGVVVARLILHYGDGSLGQLDIHQDQEILDWWNWPKGTQKAKDPNTIVAWTGKNPATTDRGLKIRLCKTAFANPHPEKEIQTIDYVSAMAGSAPFMVGLTLER
jgi:RNA polymerase sigma factor (sigma-70 family)